MLVACAALVVALGGTSYAVTQLPKNSVGTRQLKKGAVTSPKIKNGTIIGADVNKAKLGKVPVAAKADNAGNANTLDGKSSTSFLPINGKAIDASQADQAANSALLGGLDASAFLPSSGKAVDSAHADQAGHAVQSDEALHAGEANYVGLPGKVAVTAATFNFNVDASTSATGPWTTLFNFGGLTLEGRCTTAGGSTAKLELRASTDSNGSFVRNSTGGEDSDFDIAENPKTLVTADSSNGNGTILFRRGSTTAVDGEVTSVTYAWIRNSAGKACQLEGFAVGH
jgi:hypothetical protein